MSFDSSSRLKVFIVDDHFVVYVKEKAIDGKANQGVIKAMSEHLGIAPSRLIVVGGAAARIKRIEIRPA